MLGFSTIAVGLACGTVVWPPDAVGDVVVVAVAGSVAAGAAVVVDARVAVPFPPHAMSAIQNTAAPVMQIALMGGI